MGVWVGGSFGSAVKARAEELKDKYLKKKAEREAQQSARVKSDIAKLRKDRQQELMKRRKRKLESRVERLRAENRRARNEPGLGGTSFGGIFGDDYAGRSRKKRRRQDNGGGGQWPDMF